jgi:hypothetical protein
VKARIKNQSNNHRQQPKRASTGELLYFLLTFHDLVPYVPEVIRQQTLDDLKAHCPTLFEAMQVWKANKNAPEWDAFTFTYKVPLPEAFRKDDEAWGGATQ